jgi:replicative DNA helicase
VRRETEGRRPALADLRESGSIEQDADVVMFLHRDREPEGPRIETELMVAKQRNGPTDDVRLAFIPQYVRFESFQHGQTAA